jgi:hypothetical protein
LCRSVWVIDCLSFFIVPYRSSNTPLYPQSVANQGACPKFLLFHHFHFKFTFEFIKELGNVSLHKNIRCWFSLGGLCKILHSHVFLYTFTRTCINPISKHTTFVATLLWPSVGVKPNTWKKRGFGVLRDSRMFRARQQGAKHLALGCSWCRWKGLET